MEEKEAFERVKKVTVAQLNVNADEVTMEASFTKGTVSILSWNGSTNGGGSTQLYVGTTAQGLTVAQLARIRFVNPQGLPTGTYPARILSTGEVVPGPRPIVNFTHLPNAIVLSWSGNYQLLTTTNIILPFIPIVGATSPYTNLFTGAQRFFELGSPQ